LAKQGLAPKESVRRIGAAADRKDMKLSSLFEHLAPGERLGELLFGLIMTLTFTLGAGAVVGTAEGASHSLLLATIGCNVAWGVIDGILLILGRIFDRGRLARLGQAIAAATDEQQALKIVAGELDATLVPMTSDEPRVALYRDVVNRVRQSQRRKPTVTRADARAALAVFYLVFFASLPAALPYLVIGDPWVALRASNALLIGMLFWVGYHWASYTNFNPRRFAMALTALGLVLVMLAILLGG
jgi:hypothetical protein